VERDFTALSPLVIATGCNAVIAAQAAHARARLPIAAPRPLTGAIEHRGDCLVRHLTREHAHEVDNLGVGAPAMLSAAILSHLE
jgi:hypothetical protein